MMIDVDGITLITMLLSQTTAWILFVPPTVTNLSFASSQLLLLLLLSLSNSALLFMLFNSR